jgi:hypothetical protein
MELHTEAIIRSPMDDTDDSSPSAYCLILFQLPVAYVSPYKELVTGLCYKNRGRRKRRSSWRHDGAVAAWDFLYGLSNNPLMDNQIFNYQFIFPDLTL